MKVGTGVALAVVRDLRAIRPVPDDTDLGAFEQDLIAGFVLARSAAGVTDKSIQAELRAVGEFRESMGRYLWTARPDDADRLLGQRCRGQAKATIAGKAFAISVFFQYLELRHQVEIHALTGEIVQCPIDEMNRPRDDWSLNVRIPPTGAELESSSTAGGTTSPRPASTCQPPAAMPPPGCGARSACGSGKPAAWT